MKVKLLHIIDIEGNVYKIIMNPEEMKTMQVLPDINKTKTTSRRIADLRYYSSRSKRKIKCIQRYSTRELS